MVRYYYYYYYSFEKQEQLLLCPWLRDNATTKEPRFRYQFYGLNCSATKQKVQGFSKALVIQSIQEREREELTRILMHLYFVFTVGQLPKPEGGFNFEDKAVKRVDRDLAGAGNKRRKKSCISRVICLLIKVFCFSKKIIFKFKEKKNWLS